MRLVSSILLRRGIGQRSLCVALVASYLITAVGLPLPLAAPPTQSDEKYPCAGGACGCDSADKCWRSCCCHTLAEGIAWARRHGVEPPQLVLAQARAAGLDLSWLTDRSSTCGGRPGCYTKQQPPTAKAACCNVTQFTCDTSSGASQCCSEVKQATATIDDGDHIVAWRTLACRGHSMNWLAAVPILIVPPWERVDLLPLVGRLATAPSPLNSSVSKEPALPPPEVA